MILNPNFKLLNPNHLSLHIVVKKRLACALRTRLKGAPRSFRATRDAMLSASHVAATALLQ